MDTLDEIGLHKMPTQQAMALDTEITPEDITEAIRSLATCRFARSSCPSGWFFYRANCYGYFQTPRSWPEAEFECQDQGVEAHLASILDDTEASIIAPHIAAQRETPSVWIGVHDPQRNQRWKWIDGSKYDYTAWYAGQPDNFNGAEHCGQLVKSEGFLKWNDSGCHELHPFLCKYKR
ncbi:regenerating islet-derived protein 4-like [Ambystoma mexicanum]|uniref:regenerating islet-derived protein 4-like n=1 Tax=Ambystoma mexicanum TaxID=8296 RepID=UPI0037E887EC